MEEELGRPLTTIPETAWAWLLKQFNFNSHFLKLPRQSSLVFRLQRLLSLLPALAFSTFSAFSAFSRPGGGGGAFERLQGNHESQGLFYIFVHRMPEALTLCRANQICELLSPPERRNRGACCGGPAR